LPSFTQTSFLKLKLQWIGIFQQAVNWVVHPH
jgi:hypothetical protein